MSYSSKDLEHVSKLTLSMKRLSCVMLLLFTKVALSETLDTTKSPVVIPLGGFRLAPVLEVSETYNDNIFKRNELFKSSFVTQTHGGAQLSYEKNFNKYALTYAMQSMSFQDSPADDFVDHYTGINTHTEFTGRSRLDFDLKYLSSHYQRGTFLGRDISAPDALGSTPDAYHQFGLAGAYQYGHFNGKGNLAVNFSVDDYTFDNNLLSTSRQDRTQYVLTPGFNFRIAPNTRLLTEVESKWVNMKGVGYSAYDNNKQRYLVGAQWSHSDYAFAKARVGYARQRYDDPQLQNFDDMTWDIIGQWLPKDYSKIDVMVSHDPTASVGSANIRTSDRFKLGWQYHWTPRINSELTGSFENSYNTISKRKDEYSSIGLTMNYGVKRWLGVGVSYSYGGLQSSTQAYVYDQNLVMVYITGNPRISDEIRTPWATWY